MADTLYRKQGRRYYPVGVDFRGFPANGYWQVVDGRQSLIVPAEHPRPLELMRYTQHEAEIMQYVMDRARETETMMRYSIADIVRWACEWLEKRSAEDAARRKA
jgi:hypothetical protein